MSPRPAPRCPRPAGAPRLAALLVLVVTAVQLGAVPTAQAAAPLVTSLTSEGFTGRTTADPGWSLPSRSGNSACLTAGDDTAQRPIPGCASPALENEPGTLRLTTNRTGAVGTVYNTTSLPTSQGLDVRFNTYQWNSHTNPGADGINFILAATDPTNPSPPAATGPSGGSLGYSTFGGTPGVTNGYLGFGLDVYGNYRSSAFGGSGCSASTAAPQNVTVRGPGNGGAGYCVAGTQQVTVGSLDARTATSRPVPVPVEVALNPAATSTTTLGGVTIPANSWLIAFTPIGGSKQVLTGTLPSATQLRSYGFPASYFDPDTGLPYQLTFGWAASTGGNDEIHEISTLASSTLNGQLPDFNLALSDDQGGAFLAGSQATVSVSPSLDPAQGPESRPATVTTTFPNGLTPSNPTTPGYACTTSGQVVRCTYTPAAPVAAGDSLPTLAIPVQVTSAPAAGLRIVSKVSSTDANPAQATRSASVVGFAAQATPARVVFGTSATLSVSGLPGDATGTVTFASGGTTLCTATLPSTACPTVATLGAGSYPVTATYSGDARYAGQTATTSLVVTKAASTLSASASPETVPYGTATVLSANGLPAGARGTVTFTSGSRTLCVVDDVTSTTSCTVPDDLDVGSYPVVATYGGDADHEPATASTTFSVTKVAVALSASVGTSTVASGAQQTLSVAGLPDGAGGTVRFVDASGDTLCSFDAAEATSCQITADLDPGSYPVTARYAGDARHEAAEATARFDVVQAPTDVVAAVSDSSVPFGTSSTLSYSGLPKGATGTVTFTAGARTLCTLQVGDETSCVSPTTLPAGSYTITARYSGDTRHEPSDDQTALTVTPRGAPSFAASAADPSPTYGTADTLSFSGLAAGATGSVTFTSGDRVLCRIADVTQTTSCTTPDDLGTGTYPVEAAYSGDDDNAAATATTSFTVVEAPTAVQVSVGSETVVYGTPQTLSFSGLPVGATGSVTFADGDGEVLCRVDDVTEATSCTTSATLASGRYDVTATYSGDDDHAGSTATASFTVERAATPLTLGVGEDAPYRTVRTLVVGGLLPGSTGSVAISVDGRPDGGCTLDASQDARSCTAPVDLEAGTYRVTAVYSGDDDHEPRTVTTDLVVTKRPTSLSVSVDREDVSFGTAESLTFGGLPPEATGSVTFRSGDQVLCTVADVTAATSCLAPGALAVGRYPVTATYTGDRNHDGDDASTQFSVGLAVPTLSANVRSAAVPFGSTAVLTALVAVPADAPPATGPVEFTSGERTLCRIADIATTSSCEVAGGLPSGPYPVVATYGGDERYTGATAQTGFTVTPVPVELSVGVAQAQVPFGTRQVLVVTGLPEDATGTVRFTSGDRELCVVDVGESDRCQADADLPAGSYPVTALYSGDENHESDEATTTFEVTKVAVSTFEASVEPASTVFGRSTTLSFTGIPEGATGTVRFTVAGGTPDQVLCEVTLGEATSCSTPTSLEPGTYEVVATYSGDDNHQGAEATTSFVVEKAPTTVDAAPGGDAVAGSPVTLSIGGSLPDDATGTVELRSGGVTLCTIVLPSRSCVVTVATAGTLTIEAVYSGDDRYEPSTSTFALAVEAATNGGGGTGGGSTGGGSTGGGSTGGSGTDGSGTSTGGGGTLASTGGPALGVLLAGLVLVVGGAATLVTSRRARRRS